MPNPPPPPHCVEVRVVQPRDPAAYGSCSVQIQSDGGGLALCAALQFVMQFLLHVLRHNVW